MTNQSSGRTFRGRWTGHLALAGAVFIALAASSPALHLPSLLPSPAAATCGIERWPVKTGTDADAGSVNTTLVSATISQLSSLATPMSYPNNSRIAPTELTTYSVSATLTLYKLEDDSDYHLVLSDASGHTMIVEIPSPSCVGSTSPFSSAISSSRSTFNANYAASTSFQSADVPVTVTGVGFFDTLHGQTGVAPNGIELHPVLSISFGTPVPNTGAGATTQYFTWFDRASSPGFLGDNIHVVNVSSTDANVTVSVPGCAPQQRTVGHGGLESIFTCAGGFGGPVTVTSDQPVQASQRVQYFNSFNEVWGESAQAAATSLFFTWFDRVSSPGFLGDNIHVVNPGSSPATVTVSIPGCGPQSQPVAPGGEQIFTCSSGFGGPVTVNATQPVLASQRVQYFQSFNEVWGQPGNSTGTSLYFTWFDKISDPGFFGDNIHVVNPSPTDALVTVVIPGCGLQTRAVTAGGGEGIFTCVSGFGGPAIVTSDQPIIASQRVQYYQSFNEVWGVPPGNGSNAVFTWFDRISSPGFQSDNIHVVNPGSNDASVTVRIPGCSPQGPSVVHGGSEQYFSCSAGFGGPATVASTQPILASQRVKYFQSFNEVPGGAVGSLDLSQMACVPEVPNPWGYNFCGTTQIYSPPSDFCSYFNCIASFWSGIGFVVECSDQTFSKSGGRTGVCSQHGGYYRSLFAP